MTNWKSNAKTRKRQYRSSTTGMFTSKKRRKLLVSERRFLSLFRFNSSASAAAPSTELHQVRKKKHLAVHLLARVYNLPAAFSCSNALSSAPYVVVATTAKRDDVLKTKSSLGAECSFQQ